jgi:hypothetical protein
MATDLVESIRGEYLRYKALAEGTIQQLSEAELCLPGHDGGNSVATIVWHMSGNLRSRLSEFLTSDGEKPWRHRDEEFVERTVGREELLAKWNEGWEALLGALSMLTDEQIGATVTIRSQPLKVHEALHRSLAHAAYHVGQIVYLGKMFQGSEWKYLSIPPGGSVAYNRAPKSEKPAAHAQLMRERVTPESR